MEEGCTTIQAGEFCWIELAASDHSAAKNFYQTLFGWGVNEFPMGPNDMYSIFRMDERDVAAGYMLREDERAMGVPPMTIEGAGRMAVLADPQGAVFAMFKESPRQ